MTITTNITGTLLLKWLAAVCVLDSVGAAPSPPPPQYFLADGGESCTTACAHKDSPSGSAQACNLGAITSAASSVARCRDVVSALGMSFTKSGMYSDDDAGCTYHPGQTGWAQVMNSGRDTGATPAPTCDVVNADRSRRRVCACTPTGPSPSPPTCDMDLFEQPGALNHCACGEDSAIFSIDKARMHLDDCCVVNMFVSLASAAAATGKATCPASKCCISATDIPVYALGLAARQHAEMSFVASVESYVLPGSRYESTVWSNGTHDLCPYLFSKTLEHDRVTSFPLCAHVDKIIEAVSAPPEAKMFNAIQLAPDCERKLEAPQSSWDGMLMTSPATTTATATKVTDPKFGFEIAEVFAMALLRDKPFATWANDADVQQVMDVLNSYPQKSSAPLEGGVITTNTLMRGAGSDETIGPYVSQYLVQPFDYGNLKVKQRFAIENDPHEPTDWDEFIKIQDGKMPKSTPAMNGRSYTHSPRILGGNVHNDPLFQFYYNAALISFGCGIGPLGMTGTFDNSTISGFTQGGGPDLLSAVTGVAISALKAGWWHKWQQAMRIRPEAVGGLLEFCKNNGAACEEVDGLRPMYDEFRQGLKNMTLAFTGRLGGGETLLLATQYPEGSPTHPAWPAGHATVAGACVTVLKAMLKTHNANKEKLSWPRGKCTPLEAQQKKELSPYRGADKGDLTIVGELNKLASNAALGRNFAGVHFRSDGDQGLAIGEQIAIQYLKSKLQEYALRSALNSFTLEKFDGTIIEITA